jgi:hypothetical protein
LVSSVPQFLQKIQDADLYVTEPFIHAHVVEGIHIILLWGRFPHRRYVTALVGNLENLTSASQDGFAVPRVLAHQILELAIDN